MTQVENIICKLIDERAITGEETIILLKAIYGKEISYTPTSVTPNESTIVMYNMDTNKGPYLINKDESATLTTY